MDTLLYIYLIARVRVRVFSYDFWRGELRKKISPGPEADRPGFQTDFWAMKLWVSHLTSRHLSLLIRGTKSLHGLPLPPRTWPCGTRASEWDKPHRNAREVLRMTAQARPLGGPVQTDRVRVVHSLQGETREEVCEYIRVWQEQGLRNSDPGVPQSNNNTSNAERPPVMWTKVLLVDELRKFCNYIPLSEIHSVH